MDKLDQLTLSYVPAAVSRVAASMTVSFLLIYAALQIIIDNDEIYFSLQEQPRKQFVMSDFTEGQVFSSWEELQNFIFAWQRTNFVQLYTRHSRKVEVCQKFSKKTLNINLKYGEIVYACVHGGKRFKPHGQGVRPFQRYAFILIIL